MTAVSMSPAANHCIRVVSESNLSKIESFLNDTAYREAIENSSTYNSQLCRERRLRMPFLDSQTGVAQNHSALFMSARERLPGLLHGQIYTYPSKRWRKKRRQYLMHYSHPKRSGRLEVDDNGDVIEGIGVMNDDSKDSLVMKDEHSKDAWFYDEADMLDMDAFDEPDPDSDFDYEESYSSKRKRRKPRGGGHHPARNHLPSSDMPVVKRAKGGGRGRKKANFDATADADKPFVCDLCGARYKTRPGLVYHYGHSHSTSSGDPAMELSPSPAEVDSRSIADAAALDQSGGTRRGRQSSAASNNTSTTSPGMLGGSGQPGGGQLAPLGGGAPPSPSMSSQKEDSLPGVGSPGSAPSCPSPAKLDSMPLPSNMPGEMMPGIDGHMSGPGPNHERRPGSKSAAPSPYCDFCLGDARENKKTGGSEDLVSCSDCGRSGKPEEKTKRKYTRRANHN